MIVDWPFIGIKEGWIENGWTPEQMMKRSLEINIPPQLCYLEPYYMNFLQRPDMNSLVVKQVEDARDPNNAAWIASNRLWTPGQTINITFNAEAPADMQNYVKFVIMKYLQPNVSMKLNFTSGGGSSDILVNLVYMAKGGGMSAIGKQGRQQTVNLNTDRFQGKTDTSKLDDTIHPFSGGKFNLQRYLVCHEFGHAMGLYHEWQRDMCGKNGITCSDTQDMNSVMNYFNMGTMGVQGVIPSKETMDGYSPGDIAWLKKVYGGGGGGAKGPTEKIDLRQLGFIQNWPDDLTDAQVEQRVSQFLSTTPQNDIVQDDRLNSASECIMSPLILNYKQFDPNERVVSTPPSSYWPSSITQINVWFGQGESSQHDSIKQWLISDLQPHIRMNLVFEKADTGVMYTVISPAEMGTMTNPSNGLYYKNKLWSRR